MAMFQTRKAAEAFFRCRLGEDYDPPNVEVEQCGRCGRWTLSAADDVKGGIVGACVLEDGSQPYDRICGECDESMDEKSPTYAAPRLTWKALARDVLAVASPGAVEDWAVYIGAVPGRSHEAEAGGVARSGCKASKGLACFLFPAFNPDTYRE
jgi:hypothetical protein